MSQPATSAPVRSTTETTGVFVPGQRAAPEVPSAAQPIPTLSGLTAEALMLCRRDAIPISGYLVVQHNGKVSHRHEVWRLGPFALLDEGWFGLVQADDSADLTRSLAKHERRCDFQHWTSFRWVDPTSLEPGCGAPGVGLGLGANGPTYCPGHAELDPEHPSHVALTDVLRAGLRSLALGTDA